MATALATCINAALGGYVNVQSLSHRSGQEYSPDVCGKDLRLHARRGLFSSLNASSFRSTFSELPTKISPTGLPSLNRRRTTVRATSAQSSSGPVEVADRVAEGLPGNIGGPDVTSVEGSIGKAVSHDGVQLDPEAGTNASDQFKWAEAWYPAAIVADLDPKIPKAVTILGRPLVIWWDRNTTKWQAFLDQCPHRLAPLSEGRIHESGQLQCSYHGWTFGADGGCSMIPQDNTDRAKLSPKACAKVVPSVEHQGLLFVWPDLAEGAAERAAQIRPPHNPELSDSTFSKDLCSRDMSYGGDTLIENLMDPAHVPFAHHNIMAGGRVQGKREHAKPLQFKVDSIYRDGYKGGGTNMEGTFTAPCLFTLRMKLPPVPPKEGKQPENPPKERKVALLFYCVPTTPGHSKLFFSFPSNFLPKVVTMIPAWFKHLGQMTVLDSDMYFLHVQERMLEAKGGPGGWARAVYVPTASDSYVAAYRQWQNKHGGRGFEWGPYTDPRLPPTPPKEQLMDRYKSHVLQCRACKGAYRNFEILQYALAALSFAIIASLAVAAVTRQTPMSIYVAVPLVLLAGGLAVASERLGKFLYKFYHFHDYCHALVP